MLEVGATFDRYVILGSLGAGGMGEVYRARDRRLERRVALKVLRPNEDARARTAGAARILREARAAAAFDHPNAVSIFDVGDCDGVPYIAMELIDGKPLRALVRDASIGVDERLRWLGCVARVLVAAHAQGLIHRDIKPENVMIRSDGVLKVLDFGIAQRTGGDPSVLSTTEAQLISTMSTNATVAGTPLYMAPEQMRGEPPDPRIDQFAWGVLAYELLTGTLPWGDGATALQLVANLMSKDPPPLAERDPRIPEHASRAVARALQKSPAARFTTMAAALAAFEGTAVASGDASGAISPTMRSGTPPAEGAPDAESRKETTASVRPAPSKARVRFLAVAGAGAVLASVLAFVAGSKRAAAPPPAASASATAPARECARSTECVAKLGGVPAVCNATGKCAPVESDACKAHFEPGDLARDDTLWIGGMFPIGAKGESFGRGDANAVELARRDFAGAMGTYRPPPGAPAARPLATVICDSEPANGEAARHLVEDVGVPIVIDGQRSAALIELARSTYVPAGVLTFATEAISPLLTSVQQGEPRLVFRTTYDNAEVAKGIAALTAKIESDLRARGSLGSNGEMRVALLGGKNAAASAFAEALFRALVFNGKSALLNGKAYLERSYESDQELADAARDVARFGPQVVVVSGPAAAVPQVESRWPAGRPARPTYLLPSTLGSAVLPYLGSSVERRKRVLGFTLASTSVTNARLVVHYNETFDEKVTRALTPNSTYDAFYVAAYASFASGLARPAGVDLARAIAKTLPPGPAIDVGPTGIFGAFSRVTRGEAMDLNGSASSLDFDLSTGEAPADFSVVCADVDERGFADGDVESGMVYAARSGKLDGELRCP